MPTQNITTDGNKRAWTNGTIALAHGTRLQMTYRGITYEGMIRDGEWCVRDKCFSSPSLAANHVARTRLHKKTKLNGWLYWQAYSNSAKAWVKISTLRG